MAHGLAALLVSVVEIALCGQESGDFNSIIDQCTNQPENGINRSMEPHGQ